MVDKIISRLGDMCKETAYYYLKKSGGIDKKTFLDSPDLNVIEPFCFSTKTCGEKNILRFLAQYSCCYPFFSTTRELLSGLACITQQV